MLRTYDKRAERIQKGHEDQVEGIEHWVRVELQLRRKRADAAAALFQASKADQVGVMRQLAGVLRGYVEFKTPTTADSNKRRWAPAEWWLTFLGHVEKARLVVEKIVRTIEDVQDWVSSQVAPSLALLEKALGFDRAWSFLRSEATAGRARWGPRHLAILRATREQARPGG